jgi:hypothetical protein
MPNADITIGRVSKRSVHLYLMPEDEAELGLHTTARMVITGPG